MESGLLSTPEFREFSKRLVLFLHNTSTDHRSAPLPDELYPRLAVDRGITAVPTLCFMDASGDIVGRPFRSLPACEAMLPLVTRLVALRANGSPTAGDTRERVLLELELDLIPADQIEAQTAPWHLTDGEAAVFAAKLADAEAADAVGLSQEAFAARLYDMACNRRIPSSTQATMFWVTVLEHASQLRDAAVAEEAYETLQRRFEGMDDNWLRWSRPRWEQQRQTAQTPPAKLERRR